MRSASCRRFRGAILCTVLAVVLVVPNPIGARVVRIEIERVESPTFEGQSFGDVGPYEKLVGRFFGEVDPDRRTRSSPTSSWLRETPVAWWSTPPIS